MKALFKTIFFLILILAVASSCSEDCIDGRGPEVERTFLLPVFHSFTLNGSGKVYLRQGSQQSVVVKGQSNILDLIEKDVHNGEWFIGFSECTRRFEDLTFEITIADIKNVRINGSGDVITENTLDVEDIYFEVNGSGNIKAKFAAEEAKFKISGSGDIEAEGSAEELEVNIAGSGKFKGFNLPVQVADIKISGSGEAQTNVSDALNVQIAGSGDVIYKGSPQINSSISGSGKVKRE